jgi:hypothetical protein
MMGKEGWQGTEDGRPQPRRGWTRRERRQEVKGMNVRGISSNEATWQPRLAGRIPGATQRPAECPPGFAVAAGVLSRHTGTNVDNQGLAKARPVTCAGTTRHKQVLRLESAKLQSGTRICARCAMQNWVCRRSEESPRRAQWGTGSARFQIRPLGKLNRDGLQQLMRKMWPSLNFHGQQLT